MYPELGPPTPGPARFFESFPRQGGEILPVVSSVHYIIKARDLFWPIGVRPAITAKFTKTENFSSFKFLGFQQKAWWVGLPLLSHFLILSLVTMQAKVCEDASNNNRFSRGLCFLFTKHTNKMPSSKRKILLCTQCGALFCPTVGPRILRSRWGPGVGQQGPAVGTKKVSHLMQQNTS